MEPKLLSRIERKLDDGAFTGLLLEPSKDLRCELGGGEAGERLASREVLVRERDQERDSKPSRVSKSARSPRRRPRPPPRARNGRGRSCARRSAERGRRGASRRATRTVPAPSSIPKNRSVGPSDRTPPMTAVTIESQKKRARLRDSSARGKRAQAPERKSDREKAEELRGDAGSLFEGDERREDASRRRPHVLGDIDTFRERARESEALASSSSTGRRRPRRPPLRREGDRERSLPRVKPRSVKIAYPEAKTRRARAK